MYLFFFSFLRYDFCQEDKSESDSAGSHAQGRRTGEAARETTQAAAEEFDINYETPGRIDGEQNKQVNQKFPELELLQRVQQGVMHKQLRWGSSWVLMKMN